MCPFSLTEEQYWFSKMAPANGLGKSEVVFSPCMARTTSSCFKIRNREYIIHGETSVFKLIQNSIMKTKIFENIILSCIDSKLQGFKMDAHYYF